MLLAKLFTSSAAHGQSLPGNLAKLAGLNGLQIDEAYRGLSM